MAHKYEAFDGQVVFHTTFGSLLSIVVHEAIDEALPELAALLAIPEPPPNGKKAKAEPPKPAPRAQTGYIFSAFRMYLGDTVDIEFHLHEDADPDLVALRDWWDMAQANPDYRVLWRQFCAEIKPSVYHEWNNAIDAGVPERWKAPPDLRPGAPEDEALDPNAEAPAVVT